MDKHAVAPCRFMGKCESWARYPSTIISAEYQGNREIKIVTEVDTKDIKTFRLGFVNPEDEAAFRYLPGQ